MVEVAVNVVLAPLQMVVCGVLIDTVGVTFGNTVMVTAFEVETGFNTHCNDEVICTVITSLFASEVEE